MKKLLLFLTLFSMPVISAFAWPNLSDYRGCRNSDQISYQAQDLARESRQLAQAGYGRYGNRFADEARRLARASRELAQTARDGGVGCRMLERMFYERVEPAFRDLMEEARGPRRDDVNGDLRDIRRAFQDLRRELFEDDYGRGPGPGRDPRGPWDDGRDGGRGPRR